MDFFLTNFKVSFNAVASVFLIIAAGYFARRILKLEKTVSKKFNSLVFHTLIPLLVFKNIYNSTFDGASQMRIVVFSVEMLFLVAILSWVLSVTIEKEPSKRGVIAQGCLRSNYLIMGLPLLQELFPDSDPVIASVLIAVLIPLYNVISVIVLEVNSSKKISVKEMLIDLVKNPVIIASVIAFAIKFSGLTLPHFVESSVNQLGTACSPVALLVLGTQFDFRTLGDSKRDLVMINLFRLIIAPLIILTISYFSGYRGVDFALLISVFASPIAVGSFSMAAEMGGDADLAANAVATTTFFSMFSLFLWIFISKTIGVF